MNNELRIDTNLETERIVAFVRKTLKKQRFQNVIIGLSGGIDSATSFSLLTKSVKPKNIFAAHLYYFKSELDKLKPLLSDIPKKNIFDISIKDAVDSFEKLLHLGRVHATTSEVNRVRLGNIMARVRMIALYDLAKKHHALVCGTENKSEMLLGYFTRFGDEASDFEPIQHLYKTQVYQLAKSLNIPKFLIAQAPTAGLWTGQTDEGEFGFSYKEADQVLYLYFEKKMTVLEIAKKGFPNAEKIIERVKKNSFKHHLPHTL